MTNAVNIAQSGSTNVSWRNRIINGDMRIDQRNAGASVTFTNQYLVDRWAGVEDTDGAMTAQQVADAPTGFVNSLKFTTTTADASLAATQYASTSQFIEGYNTSDLAWGSASAQTITISFWVKSSLTGTFGGSLRNNGYNRSYPFTYAISAANTWEQKTVTIAGDTSGTWATTTDAGIRLSFGLGVGSTYSGTAGSWSSNNYITSTGATSVIGTLNATWQITGVQLEAGSVASPFERRDYGREFALCQRYYETSYPPGYPAGYNFGEQYPWGTSKPNAVNFIASDDQTTSVSLRFVVQKRASPTVVIYSPNNGSSGFAWVYKGTGGAGNVSAGVTYTSESLWNISQSLSAINQANESYFHFTSSAEL
jgi:hypothetical protein